MIVIGDKDIVILKTISPSSMEEFDELIAKARKHGKRAGIKKSDIAAAIAKDRYKK